MTGVQTCALPICFPVTIREANNEVEVISYYGQYVELLCEDGDVLLTEGDELIMIEDGRPDGKKIFTGYISQWELDFGLHGQHFRAVVALLVQALMPLRCVLTIATTHVLLHQVRAKTLLMLKVLCVMSHKKTLPIRCTIVAVT